MHYTEGTIEIFGLVLGVGAAILMVVGATALSRMLARDEEQHRAGKSTNVISIDRARTADRGNRAA